MQEQSTTRPVTPMTPEAGRLRLADEFGNRCFRCAVPPDPGKVLDVDHIVPVARGGINVYENYQLLCGSCNSWKGLRIIDFRPGKSRKEIYADLPVLPNDQRVRRNRSQKVSERSLILTPPPALPIGHTKAQAVTIRELRAALASADATIDGLRNDLDDLRARTEYEIRTADARRAEAEQRAAELASEVEKLRARPWWRFWG